MIKLDVAHKNFINHLNTAGRSHSTVIAYKKDIEQLIEFLFKKGVNLVSEINLEHLKEFMAKLTKEGFTAKSISRKTNSTKTFFRYLYEEGIIVENVSENLKHPKVDSKAPRILSKVEYRALRDAVKGDIRTYAIVEILLQTGIRISELAAIKTEDLTLNTSNPKIYIRKSGSNPAREIPLNKAAVTAINEYLKTREESKNDNLFVTKSGNPLLVRNIRATIDRYFKAAGIENAKVNDLRHTFVAHHLSAGVNITTISKIAGHKRVSTTERYLQYIEISVNTEKHELSEL